MPELTFPTGLVPSFSTTAFRRINVSLSCLRGVGNLSTAGESVSRVEGNTWGRTGWDKGSETDTATVSAAATRF